MPEKEMSLQQAMEFWAYLHEQAELKKQAYLDTPRGNPYKDEMRTEAETYGGIMESFARNFEQPISSAQDIVHGLRAEQAEAFLNHLDEMLKDFQVRVEDTRRKKQEALAEAEGVKYDEVKRIYNATENNEERQVTAVVNARKRFISIVD